MPIIEALIATEDRSFYHHFGVSLRGVFRAIYLNFKENKIVSGGSTLTQQLVRNRLQPEKRNYFYKIKEIYFALRLEREMNKEEILESYLNNAYFGHQAYGISAASHIYFGKNINELSLAESSLLIGLLQSPSAFDPFIHFKDAKKRQETVLNSLKDSEKISLEQLNESKNEALVLTNDRVDIRAPHFIDFLKKKHTEEIEKNKNIITTLDLDLQTEIESIIQSEIEKLKEKNVSSASVVVLDAKSGDLLAMIGSGDYWNEEHDGQVNITTSLRQPGSALKPFTYALALESGETAATTIADIETQFFTQEGNPYIPRNYDYSYHGLVRYREALANSYNISAVKVLEKIGVKKLLNFLQSAGITTLNKSPEFYGLALTLGDGEVKLLELTKAYGIFARGGKTLPLRFLFNEAKLEGKQVLDEKAAWLIADILSDNDARLPEFGSDSVLNFNFPVAAKTGTTRNSRDNWTLGFSRNRIIGVWVGNADNSPMRGTSGVTGAGPIFQKVVLAATKNFSAKSFQKPEGISLKEICKLSGKLPTKNCPYTISEYFIQGTEPRETDDIFQSFKIDKRNNLLAENCEKKFIKEEVFAIFPLELKTWARMNGFPEAPQSFSLLCKQNLKENSSEKNIIEIIKPKPFDSFRLDPLVPDENEKIIFEAHSKYKTASINWFVNDEFVGSGTTPNFRFDWSPHAGKYKITAKGDDVYSEVDIEIIE